MIHLLTNHKMLEILILLKKFVKEATLHLD